MTLTRLIKRPDPNMNIEEFKVWVARNWPKQLARQFSIQQGTFTEDSPDTLSVAWAGVVVEYNFLQYLITDGNTSNKWLYWELSSPNTIQSSASVPSITDDLILVGANVSGAFTPAWKAGQGVLSELIVGYIQAGNIEANSITTNMLKVTSESICPDPNFVDESFWSYSITDWTFLTRDTGNTAETMGVPKCVELDGDDAGNDNVQIQSIHIPYSAIGNNLRIRARCYNTSNQTLRVRCAYRDKDHTLLSTLAINSTAGAGLEDLSSQGTVPANTAYINFIIDNAGTPDPMTGTMGVANVRLENAVTANLIVDGTITTTQIAALTITAANIAAATITGAKIAATTITAANIAALTITGAEIAASTITSNKMSVSQLSAIAADMGAITAGTITLSTAGNIKAGQTAYNTGTGFWLGIDSSTPKFSIGDGTSNYMAWSGSALTVVGATFTAGTIQTSATASTGIKIDPTNGIRIYDAGNVLATHITNVGIIYTNSILAHSAASSLVISGYDGGHVDQIRITTADLGDDTVDMCAIYINHDTDIKLYTGQTERLKIDSTGLSISNASTGISMQSGDVIKINNIQVVGAQQAHIIDADGNLADITTKFNTLLSELETFGVLASA